jgi:hypothetical protein
MFAAKSVEQRGGFRLSAPPSAVFDLFSPLGEKLWVPEWDPELIHPPGFAWDRGLIFRTREERGEAIWLVTAFDRARHAVEYHRVETGRYVARVSVQCRDHADLQTDVDVAYSFVGLSEAGNREIQAMSAQSYEEKMVRWQGWIQRYLSHAPREGP